MYSRTLLIGRIGHNAEAKMDKNQQEFVVFSIATQDLWKTEQGSTTLAPDGTASAPGAEALGTTQRVISYYETEAELPPSTAIIPLARILGVSADELLGLRPARVNGNASLQKQRLWKRFQKMEGLPTKDQRAVIRLINSLAGSVSAEAS